MILLRALLGVLVYRKLLFVCMIVSRLYQCIWINMMIDYIVCEMCVCACVRACVRACVHVCKRPCACDQVRVRLYINYL